MHISIIIQYIILIRNGERRNYFKFMVINLSISILVYKLYLHTQTYRYSHEQGACLCTLDSKVTKNCQKCGFAIGYRITITIWGLKVANKSRKCFLLQIDLSFDVFKARYPLLCVGTFYKFYKITIDYFFDTFV